MTPIVVGGGTVVDRNGSRRADVVIDSETGLIHRVVDPGDQPIPDDGSMMLDATGCVVAPGLVDLGAHLRQPGNEAAETIDSAARAAALGGYTAIVALPDTDPCTDNAAVVSDVLALAKSAACEVVPAGAVTTGRAGASLAPLAELVQAGVRVFTDAASSIEDPALLRRALEYLDGIGEMLGVRAVIADRAELRALAGDGVMNDGEWSARLGLPGRPAQAEEIGVARALAVARLAGAPLHLRQLSTEAAVDLVRAAKEAGQPVTADVSPHHLVLDESACRNFDTRAKLLPPLRTPSDREALVAGMLDGTIDAIATAHAPCAVDAKERPFDEAPFGATGLETTLSLLLTELDLAVEDLLGPLAWQPAAIAGLADRHGGPIESGRPANLTVIDLDATWTVGASAMASRSSNTPYAGRELTGRARHTIAGGVPRVIDGRPVDGSPVDAGPVDGNMQPNRKAESNVC